MPPVSPLDILRGKLKEIPLTRLLPEIGSMSAWLFDNHKAFDEIQGCTVTQWQLGFLARESLLVGNANQQGLDATFDLQTILELATLYYEIDDPIVAHGTTVRDAFNALLRMSYQQFLYQSGHNRIVPRALFLYHIIPCEMSGAPIYLPDEIQRIHGLSIGQLIGLACAICVLVQSNRCGKFQVDALYREVSGAVFNPSVVQQFLTRIAANETQFASSASAAPPAPAGYELYAFNPLVKFPIICVPNADGLMTTVPNTPLLYQRVTNGLYWDLMDHFNAGGHANPFSGLFGTIFERYVGRVLGHLAETGRQVYSERELSRGTMTTDWFVKEIDTLLLIECKKRPLSLATKSWGDPSDLAVDIKELAKGCVQLWKTVKALEAGHPALSDLVANRYHCLIVTHEPIWFGNDAVIRETFDQEVRSLDASVDPSHAQLISIEELERLVVLLDHMSIAEAFSDKTSNQHREVDFDVWIRDCSTMRGISNLRNTMLDDENKRFFQWVKSTCGATEDSHSEVM